MFLSSFNQMMHDDIIVYHDLGNEETYGICVDEMIDMLKERSKYRLIVGDGSRLMPFIVGEDDKLHPVFKEDVKVDEPCTPGFEFSSERLPKSFFDEYGLDILVIDQELEYNICRLCCRQETLAPDTWEFWDDLVIHKDSIFSFIRLLRKIQYAKLSDILA